MKEVLFPEFGRFGGGLVLEPIDIVPVLNGRRQRWGPVSARTFVNGKKLLFYGFQRPSVDNDVMAAPDELMLRVADPENSRPDQTVLHQIEIMFAVLCFKGFYPVLLLHF